MRHIWLFFRKTNPWFGRFLWVFILMMLIGACQTQTYLELTPRVPPTEIARTAVKPDQIRIAAGFTPTPLPSPTPFPVAGPTPIPAATAVIPEQINPLTGSLAADYTLLKQPPVLVKLANWPQELRPANGLLQADNVFEYYIGAQQNHLLALFYGTDGEKIGPLAPVRIPDVRLAEHYQGTLIIASAPDKEQSVLDQMLKGRYFQRGDLGCPAICTEAVTSGGNTVVNTSAIRQAIKNPFKPVLPLIGPAFQSALEKWDDDAQRFSYLYADFSVMDWRWNDTEQKYDLWQDYEERGSITLQPSKDRDTHAPIRFDNIVFLFSMYSEVTPTYFDINFRDGILNQPALILRDGKLIHGYWFTKTAKSPIQLRYLDGSDLPLKPGKTWYVFTSVNSLLERVQPGEWDLTFILR
ncbi:MAG: DUF3048 C-terminal domain-containing protein [Anaerolineaceae bacterium]|jgi:hypothetical protein